MGSLGAEIEEGLSGNSQVPQRRREAVLTVHRAWAGRRCDPTPEVQQVSILKEVFHSHLSEVGRRRSGRKLYVDNGWAAHGWGYSKGQAPS